MGVDEGIPFVDLVTPHRQLEEELVQALREAVQTARFIGGPEIELFESEFAEFCKADHCVGVANGTDALRFALIASGVERGDTVLTVAHTFIATVEAISQAGAAVDFVDIDERTCNIDPERLSDYLDRNCDWVPSRQFLVSRRTGTRVRAVVPVHLYGQMADMDAILEMAGKFNFKVVEDACQAHGAQQLSRRQSAWRHAGSLGDAAAFSFYPGKNLGACGEAGAVITRDADAAQTVRMLRDHGQSRKYLHEFEGYNGRLDAIQAAFLRIKLRHLEEWNAQRRAAADVYHELLQGIENLTLPFEAPENRGVFHLFVIRSDRREALVRGLEEARIGYGFHYPTPLHLQPAYRALDLQFDLPKTEGVARTAVSLPMYPGLRRDQQERVAAVLRHSLGQTAERTSAAIS